MKSIFMIVFFLVLISIPAQAQIFQGDRYVGVSVDREARCPPPFGCQKIRAKKSKTKAAHSSRRRAPAKTIWTGFRAEAGQAVENTRRNVVAILGGRPAGCPHRFCGCALSIKLFGRQVAGLNLAANWLRFGRTAPDAGMVAVRRGHVFQLLAHVGGPTWRVWDANSGRGRIRIHHRSIAGYVIVNPSSSRIARL